MLSFMLHQLLDELIEPPGWSLEDVGIIEPNEIGDLIQHVANVIGFVADGRC